MLVIVLASQKGGAGKTTLTSHLAVALEEANLGPSVLIDTDPQASLASWWNSRESETPSLATTTRQELGMKLSALEKSGFKFAFIDTPPAITCSIEDVINLADIVIIPSKPSPIDLRAVGSTVDLAKKYEKKFLFCVTQANASARLTLQTLAALSAHGEVSSAIIHNRVDFASSMINGKTVLEVDPKGKSASEIRELLLFVLKRLGVITKNKKKECVQ